MQFFFLFVKETLPLIDELGIYKRDLHFLMGNFCLFGKGWSGVGWKQQKKKFATVFLVESF